MFNVNEIKSWAKSKGLTVKKSGDGYVWFAEGEEQSTPHDINEVARQIFNRITGNKWKEHQEEWMRSQKTN